MGEESERRVVPASEILAKIERGEAVEYDDVIIEGDLDSFNPCFSGTRARTAADFRPFLCFWWSNRPFQTYLPA